MTDQIPLRAYPPSGGFVTLGTLIFAAVAAVAIVALSGCHAPPADPATSGFASSNADKAAQERLRQRDGAFKPLQPFDEGFVVVADPDAN